MIRWKRPQLDRYSVFIALTILAGLFVLATVSGVEDLQPGEVLKVLSLWGFAEELILTAVGAMILAFLAGRGKNRAVAVGGIVLLLLANSTMAGPANSLSTYPTTFGTDRLTLLESAETDPHIPIYQEIPLLLTLGEILGTARLITPLLGIGDRLRAMTDIDVIIKSNPYQLPPGELSGLGKEQEIGMLSTTPVSVIGEGVEYVWLDGRDGIYIVASNLLEAPPP